MNNANSNSELLITILTIIISVNYNNIIIFSAHCPKISGPPEKFQGSWEGESRGY